MAMILKYTVGFPEPATHCAEIQMDISGYTGKDMCVYMPVWTPGSYLIREFSRNIESWSCNFSVEKINKNTWKITGLTGEPIQFSYRVYAFELTVRTSYIDDSQAYLNGSSIFLVPEGKENLPSEIKLLPHPAWKEISTSLSLSEKDKWMRKAGSYHELADSPILLSNQEILSFDVFGVPHQVAISGTSNLKKKKFLRDLQKICETETELVGEHPCKSYLFLIHHTENLYGGLEHLNCSSNFIPRWDYNPGEKYNSSMSLLAHEYFHLWNIKRFRPAELATYDYNNEQYTRQLWVAEGITSYYDDYFTYKAGIETKEEYLKIVADNISRVVNRPGDRVQSLADASFDTWVKYYRPNENTVNSQVHYYQKGAAIALALNCLILHKSGGKRSLDDVVRALYQLWKRSPEKGYTEAQVLKLFENAAGTSLKTFFRDHIYGTIPIDYTAYFSLIGMELKNKPESNPYPGWTIEKKDGRYIISVIERGYGAIQGGIQVSDEILGLDGYRMNDNYQDILAGKKSGDYIDVLISRKGIVTSLQIPVTINSRVAYSLSEKKGAGATKKKLAKIWLKR